MFVASVVQRVWGALARHLHESQAKMCSCCLLLAPPRVLGADGAAATALVAGVVQTVLGALHH